MVLSLGSLYKVCPGKIAEVEMEASEVSWDCPHSGCHGGTAEAEVGISWGVLGCSMQRVPILGDWSQD